MKYFISKSIKLIYYSQLLLFDILFFPFLLIILFVSRVISKHISIGIGPLPMINNVYWKKALERKGYSAETYTQAVYYITDEFDFVCDRDRNRIFYYYPILLFLKVVLRYECLYIYFNGGPLQRDPFLVRLEPLFLNWAAVKVVVMPYGSDCQIFERTPNKTTVNNLCSDYPLFFKTNHDAIISQVDRWTKYAEIIIGTMDSVDYLYYWNRVIPCHFAIDTDRVRPDDQRKRVIEKKGIRILHAPNHMSIKGTEFLEKAIKRLLDDGYKIDYVRIQSKPNAEVLEEIRKADIVVDQLVMGWYAMFAMETMACGKPCICYIRQDLEDLYVKLGLLEKGEIPLISATTDTIYDILKDLLDHPGVLEKIGERSREYVVKRHSLDYIGEFYAKINNDINVKVKSDI